MYAEGNAEVIPPIGTINHMGKGPNFTDGKHFHMVGACCSLMVQMLPSVMNLIPIPPRHLPERARDSFLPSRLLTEKRCSRQRVPASQQYFSSRSDGSRRIHRRAVPAAIASCCHDCSCALLASHLCLLTWYVCCSLFMHSLQVSAFCPQPSGTQWRLESRKVESGL